MQFPELQSALDDYKNRGLQLFTTCSFQTHSIVLLHMVIRIDKTIPVYFINTGFHFPETILFKDTISKLFDIEVKQVSSVTPKSMQKDLNDQLLFTSDPDYCCFLNKTQPMEPLLKSYDVWINGVRGDQSSVRKNFKVEQPTPFRAIRFHPMLDWTQQMIYKYLKAYDIPVHPLESKGYFSIGCEPCTRKFDIDSRNGRWFGLNKTECGLNTDLVKQ